MPKPTTAAPANDRPMISLDSIATSRAPDFELGGLTFEGRLVGWTVAVDFDGRRPKEQAEILVRVLRARSSDPDAMTDEWLEQHLTPPVANAVVGILFRGETPKV